MSSAILSTREQELICYLWQSLKSAPEVSYIPVSLSIHHLSPTLSSPGDAPLLRSLSLRDTP
jgi:hypothetical protein